MRPPIVHFVIQVDGIGQTESGKEIPVYVARDKFGPGQDGFVAKPEIATHFNLPSANVWLDANPEYGSRAKIVHALTGQVVRP